MRIIGGQWRGRRLLPPADQMTRPTSDRLRERLFNILSHHPLVSLTESRVLDLFAGTGALGLEALSRGAAHAVLVDQSPDALRIIRANVSAMDAPATPLRADATALPPASEPVDLVFLDPPYGKGLLVPAVQSAQQQGWIKQGSIMVLEQPVLEPTPQISGFQHIDQREQGRSRIVMFSAA